jgi:transmembrane sensor
MDSNEIMDDLLVKTMLGEASQTEQQQVDDWLREDAGNRRYFSHFKLIWIQSKELAARSETDEHEAWKRFKARTQRDVPIIPIHSRSWKGAFKIAAMLFLALGAGWLFYIYSIKNSGSDMITVRSETQALTDTLPDGSVVTLNKRSSISYAKEFTNTGTRQITLNGEAFFDVQPDKSKPFVINVNDVTVTVVGTSFNIKSNKKKTEVIVETGIVKVGKAGKQVDLNPRESVSVGKAETNLVKHKNDDGLYDYYRTKKFVCNGTPLWKLVETLNEAYNADILIERESLKNLSLTTTFNEQPLPGILRIVGETFGIRVEQRGDKITLN